MHTLKSALVFLLHFWIISPIVLAQIEVVDLRCEYKRDPIGIDIEKPRFSWKIETDRRNVRQTAYQIQVFGSPEELKNQPLWDTGKTESDRSVNIEYEGRDLRSRERYFWQVRIWDERDKSTGWSEVTYWEMGLLDPEEWEAEWIHPGLEEIDTISNPSPFLRTEFGVNKEIKSARLYITSHGLYEAHINGQRVGDQLFTPGWTSYHKRLQYQTYDVTALLTSGVNAIGVILGDGWFRGNIGWVNNRNHYGNKLALLAQLEVTYEDGSRELVVTDNTWKSATGPILKSDIYNGEVYDARMEMVDWAVPGFNESGWENTVLADITKDKLVAPEGPPVRKIETLEPVEIITTPKGETVVDIGQNMVGWVRIRISGREGDRIVLHHAEVLDQEGNFYTANLRSADQRVEYILKDSESRWFEPNFTFQGFRYIKIEGYPGELSPEDVEGVVIYSDMEQTGTFECSNPLVNQLQHNILWGQKGNFLDVPTDCPQRDERLGWTGDAQVFASTASFNMDVASFFTKWLKDLAADQLESGSVPFVIPNVLGEGAAGSTGWADAATIIPWTMYQQYGDKRLLEQQYPSMKAWVEFMKKMAGENLLYQRGSHFGDWLFFIHPTDWNNKPGYTDKDLISTAFFAHSSNLLAKAARVLGREEDSQAYKKLSERIKQAFRREFITPSGRLSSHSQTAYALALAFDLVPDDLRSETVNYLVENIKSREYHLSTGFLGTPHLMSVLTEQGHLDIAYKLLLQDTYPSWLYPVKQGATTIWERWDGIKPDGSFQTPRMNSFNHYAYGAIGHWMYTVAAGIRPDPDKPGYKHIIIKPQPGDTLEYARATHRSLYGTISSHWERADDQFKLKITTPANTTATVYLPRAELPEVQAQNKKIFKDVISSRQEGRNVIVEVGSGQNEFSYTFSREQ